MKRVRANLFSIMIAAIIGTAAFAQQAPHSPPQAAPAATMGADTVKPNETNGNGAATAIPAIPPRTESPAGLTNPSASTNSSPPVNPPASVNPASSNATPPANATSPTNATQGSATPTSQPPATTSPTSSQPAGSSTAPLIPPPPIPAFNNSDGKNPGAPASSNPANKSPATDNISDLTRLDIPARPVAMVRGSSNWEDGYKNIMAAIKKAREAAAKANFKETGRPMAAFVDSDDNGFKFEAMIPLESAPEGKIDLAPDVKIGQSPAGKAFKFPHRGAYDDVDSTYEAITAFLDEKGLEARDVFVEEYMNDVNGSDDANMQVDIYVFIK